MTALRKYAASVVVMLLVIFVTLVYAAKTHIEEFREEQIKIAVSAARNTEVLLQRYVADLRRSVDLFFIDNRQGILDLLNSETRYKARAALQQRLHQELPDAIVFTLADAAGQPLLDDDENIIDDSCRENIRLFASDPAGISAQLRMHADKIDGHFDIVSLVPISIDEDAILLVEFKANRIALYLNLLQPPGHSLFLAKWDRMGRLKSPHRDRVNSTNVKTN